MFFLSFACPSCAKEYSRCELWFCREEKVTDSFTSEQMCGGCMQREEQESFSEKTVTAPCFARCFAPRFAPCCASGDPHDRAAGQNRVPLGRLSAPGCANSCTRLFICLGLREWAPHVSVPPRCQAHCLALGFPRGGT
jgi:hypothetical protein